MNSSLFSIGCLALFSMVPSAAIKKGVDEMQLPPDCVRADFSKYGRPVMFPAREGIALGLSAYPLDGPEATFVNGERVGVEIWVDNQTGKPYGYGTCSSNFSINVFNRSGQPLVHKQSQLPAICASNTTVYLTAHSCAAIQYVNLANSYELQPGQYVVRVRRKEEEKGNSAKLRDGLTITIQTP